jgi:hypothetical protein
VSYLPDADYYGSDSFVFSADDGRGGVDTGTVSIAIRAVDDPPVAEDDDAATHEGMVVDISVLANDRDPDGSAVRVLQVTQGVNGSVVVNGDDTVRYQPISGFTGSDGFAYTLGNGGGSRTTATVTVSVRPAADDR